MAKNPKNWYDAAPAIGVDYNEEPKAEVAKDEKKAEAPKPKAAAKKAPAAKAKADDADE